MASRPAPHAVVLRMVAPERATLERARPDRPLSEELRGQLDRTGLAAVLQPDNVFMEREDLGLELDERIAAAKARASGRVPHTSLDPEGT